MIQNILDIIKEKYTLTSIDPKEFSSFKVKGMKFNINAYYAEGLGHISTMKAKGLFGLMKMDTLIIVPKEKDLPLYSYDRIHAMGNDTLIVELYDTLIDKNDFSNLNKVKEKYQYLEERDPGKHWYDSIKLSQSISKKGKKKNSNDFDCLTLNHFIAYLNTNVSEVVDLKKKEEKTSTYVMGLLENGGPSTDVFIKEFGKDKTIELYKKVLFGIIKD